MQTTMWLVIPILLVTSAVASANRDQNTAKLRRDGVMNLYPFPRVGRASHTWQLPSDDYFIDIIKPSNNKRQLYAFPRVGRTSSDGPERESTRYKYQPDRTQEQPFDADQIREESMRSLMEKVFGRSRNRYAKRESFATGSTGMWFGPRLGRGDKSNEEDDTPTQDKNETSEPEQLDVE